MILFPDVTTTETVEYYEKTRKEHLEISGNKIIEIIPITSFIVLMLNMKDGKQEREVCF